jgi:hypothetical protein
MFFFLFLFAQAKLEIAPKSCPFRDEMKNTQKDLFSKKGIEAVSFFLFVFLFFFKKENEMKKEKMVLRNEKTKKQQSLCKEKTTKKPKRKGKGS